MHSLLGLLSLLFYTALTVAPQENLPFIMQAANNLIDNNLILATTIANLCLGLYMRPFYSLKRRIQLLASVLIISSLPVAIYSAVIPTSILHSLLLQQIAQYMLVAGISLHLLINLKALTLSTPSPEQDSDRETGTVKWFNVSKGFGFITRDIGDDVFVHYRAIRGTGHRALREGQRVAFIVVENNKGYQAEDVSPL